jgi:hypothetical protein
LHWVLLHTQKIHNRTPLFGNISLKHGRHFDYWNQPLNTRMRVCYLYCLEAGLCWYLVIHTENALGPLQLFYFHLWRIYWLSLVCFRNKVGALCKLKMKYMAKVLENVYLRTVIHWRRNFHLL